MKYNLHKQVIFTQTDVLEKMSMKYGLLRITQKVVITSKSYSNRTNYTTSSSFRLIKINHRNRPPSNKL